MANKDVTELLQRLEAFEDRLGVRLEAVSAFEDDEWTDEQGLIVVRGELHPAQGTSIASDVNIKLSVYDSEGRIVGSGHERVWSADFFGFHTFEIFVDIAPGLTKQMRLFPAAA